MDLALGLVLGTRVEVRLRAFIRDDQVQRAWSGHRLQSAARKVAWMIASPWWLRLVAPLGQMTC